MRLRVIAVGTRMPSWVRSACTEYLQRLRAALPVELTEVAAAARRESDVPRAMGREGERLLAALAPRDYVVALDERGRELTTRELATWLGARMQQGEDLAFLIGGPDGLAPAVLARSNFRLALSRLTLPHALARVLLSEQLYRAHCILANHPYHRD
ncbi:MAG: 23S rRNA (pseudouridine(1915)-N(3))-methyltransferase RlmH [Gammaproteobacteria bacterium]|nr:23S rRNA (pseudouridine(1915)-N(3))-methyltransferase RlmH [Gammaproteobacteria bacterium]MBV8405346.1 23S rRNA (pseudouridine(1915)-N(3))-methyltransferase RlmH [Gammaproteobacteria bacterium]